jgi:hypothetical protein
MRPYSYPNPNNEALAVIEGGTFDSAKAVDKVRAVDKMFEESFTSRFQAHLSNDPD